MPFIENKQKTEGHVLKREQWPEDGICREIVTVNEASDTELEIGHVLGKVTADGKYKISVQDAVDGSETADAVVLEYKSVPAATDTQVMVLIRGDAIVGKDALILDASYDLDAEKQAAYDALEAKRIFVRDQV